MGKTLGSLYEHKRDDDPARAHVQSDTGMLSNDFEPIGSEPTIKREICKLTTI